MTRALVLTLVALLPVRPAHPADDVAHPASGWSEEWRVIAFDRATHGSVSISLAARPIPWLEVRVWQGGKLWSADAELPNGLLDHRGPGVTIANLPDNAPPQTNLLSYAGGKYVVDLTWPARGRVTVTPGRAGVVAGPWRLGKERVLPANPTRYVPGTMTWSVPVAVGTASGSIEAYGHRIAFRGWQAYHDHTWGRFRLSSTSWAHSDFAVVSPRRGEAWILNGLEPTEGGFHGTPNDRHWQGVLVHATRAGVSTCAARITRRGWLSYPMNLGGFGWDYLLPSFLRARCGGHTVAAGPIGARWTLWRLFSGGLRASSPLARGNGWVEHGTPPLPTS
jgi:hypothetical protein